MKEHWTAFAVGIVIGAGLGWFMASGKAKGANIGGPGKQITGGFAAPFQQFIRRG